MKIFQKIKFYFKRFILKYKYKKNYGHKQNPIICGIEDRSLGKTTLVINDAAKRNIPIIVSTQMQKHFIKEEAHRRGLEVVVFATSDNIRGRKDKKVLLDGDYNTYMYCLDNHLIIMNGFMYLSGMEKNYE